jgi:single-strand DNA-binding protein
MLNQAQLIGYTGAEPEIRTTTSGKQVATLRVCTSRYSKAKGERKDYPTWHQVEIWTPATVNWLATKGLPIGAKIFVQGEIRHDRYTDKDGVERFFSKVVVTAPGQTLTALDRPEPTLAEPA